MERHETEPYVFQILAFPSLRSEFVGVITVDFMRTMHMIWRIPNTKSFPH